MDTYREMLIFRINESRVRKIELATLPTEMALLAAQQVNEARFKAVESPKEVGWDAIAFEFVLGFVINSSFMEKLAAKLFQKVYGSILSSQLALNVLPKSLFGAVAAKVAAVPSRALAHELTEVEGILARHLARYTKLETTSKHDLTIYSKFVNEFVSDAKNASAFVKGVREGQKKGPPKKAVELQATDGASVIVVEHFFSAARAQRMHIESLHNKYELIARLLPLKKQTTELLDQMFDLAPIVDSGTEALNLDQISSGMRIRFEAMIWAIHLGFSRKQVTPHVDLKKSPDDYDVFRPSIDEKIVRYLLERFGPITQKYLLANNYHNTSMAPDQTAGSRAASLRNYFWAITDEF